MAKARIPDVAVKRLPIYLRVLDDLQEAGVEIISSADLARSTGFSSEQIRKDLAYFGAFGTRGVGYSVSLLSTRIKRILGLDREVPVALIGAGNLGTALARNNRTRHQDVVIRAIFDNDPKKIGQTIDGLEILPIDRAPEVLPQLGIRMAILAVPASEAQPVTDLLVGAGVEALLNFSPAKLVARNGAHIQNIDLSIELQTLAYYTSGEGSEAGEGPGARPAGGAAGASRGRRGRGWRSGRP